MAEDKEKEEKRRTMITVRGNDYTFYPFSIKKILKEQYVDESQNIVYTLSVIHFDDDQTNIKFFDEEVRDKEYLNLVSKMDELGIDTV